MKIEFNGRVVSGFLLGAFCGGVAALLAVSGPLGRIQLERDEARATIERQNAQIQQLQSAIAAQQKTATAASPLQLLDVVRPGLGTLAVAANQAIKADQARRAAVVQAAALPQPVSCGSDQVLAMGQCITCNPGLHPGTFPNGDAGCVAQ